MDQCSDPNFSSCIDGLHQGCYPPLVFIRVVKKKIAGPDGPYLYVHHRLIESVRTPSGPRQKVIFNLGTLSIPQEKFKALADRIEAELANTTQKSFWNDDPEIVALAQHYAGLIKRKMRQEVQKRIDITRPTEMAEEETSQYAQYETVDVNSTQSSNVRTIGAEHIALTQLRELSFFHILDSLGFNPRQKEVAAAQICARLCHPASESESARWLRETSGLDELLGANFSKLSDNSLHQGADQLLAHKDALEEKLARASRDLFTLDEQLILYDLTNTYFESPKLNSRIALYGHSKEKRTDCPIVTLALIVDGRGFPKRSRIFEGNVSEPGTLWNILEELGQEPGENTRRTIVMDAGLATEANLQRLRDEKRFNYVAISRRTMPRDNMEWTSEEREIEISHDKTLTLRTARDGDEAFLLCKSPDRFAKDEAIFSQRRSRFEKELRELNEGLSKPRARKKQVQVVERLGRLKERYRLGTYYKIAINTDGDTVTGIQWAFDATKQNDHGEYLIRTNRIDLLDHEISGIHRTLTMIESAFRWLKSDLGLRPNYHQKDKRIEGHIFISVLAYFILASILSKLGWGGEQIGYTASSERMSHSNDIQYGWKSVVRAMETQVRVTTSFVRKNGQPMHIHTTTEPTSSQRQIYKRLQIKPRPLKRIVVS